MGDAHAAHGHGIHEIIDVASYVNPLPHVLMLTAIVVSIATTGVALAALILIFRRYKTLNEDEILKIRREAGV
jgi:multicomponent Na+:H+ antiporter subunit C